MVSRSAGRRVTVRDIAAHTGVSIATVSRALNGQANVAPDTRELVRRGDAIAGAQWEGERTDALPLDRLKAHEVYMDTAWMDRGAMRNAIE